MARRELIFACLIVTVITVLVLGLMVVPLTLFVSPSRPTISIDLFNDQALNTTTSNNPPTLTIQFDLKLENLNWAVGLYYPDPVIITFSYFPNVSMMVFLAEYKLDSFYQGNEKTRYVRDMVGTNHFPMVLEGTHLIAFQVDLMATIRYKLLGSKRLKMELGCPIEVNHTTGKKMKRGFIILVKPGFDPRLNIKRVY